MSKKAVSKEEKQTVPKKEEKKAEVKSKKSDTPKTGKKPQKGVHVMYNMDNDKITRLRPTCERCGPGYFMADHNDRYTCGHCGFTRYKRA